MWPAFNSFVVSLRCGKTQGWAGEGQGCQQPKGWVERKTLKGSMLRHLFTFVRSRSRREIRYRFPSIATFPPAKLSRPFQTKERLRTEWFPAVKGHARCAQKFTTNDCVHKCGRISSTDASMESVLQNGPAKWMHRFLNSNDCTLAFPRRAIPIGKLLTPNASH